MEKLNIRCHDHNNVEIMSSVDAVRQWTLISRITEITYMY